MYISKLDCSWGLKHIPSQCDMANGSIDVRTCLKVKAGHIYLNAFTISHNPYVLIYLYSKFHQLMNITEDHF